MFGVVEVCGDGDDCVGYCVVQVCFGVVFEFYEDVCGDFLWCLFFVVDVEGLVGVYVVFDGSDCLVDVGDGLVFCGFVDEYFFVFGEGYD